MTNMYERLDKLRDEVKRMESRRNEADQRLKAAQAKLKEAEAAQILSDVGAMKLTPEQVAQFLQMASSGQFPAINAATKGTNSRNFEKDFGYLEHEEKENEKITEDEEDENE